MTMESANLTEEYYALVTGGVIPRGRLLALVPGLAIVETERIECSNGLFFEDEEAEMLEAIDRQPQPMTLCAECPYLGQCTEPIELPCPLDGRKPQKE